MLELDAGAARWERRVGHNVLVRTIEHRRHTMRAKPGQHLNQAGVDLARRVGDGMGRFDRVVTSRLPRAFETAIAMGYAIMARKWPDWRDQERAATVQPCPRRSWLCFSPVQ